MNFLKFNITILFLIAFIGMVQGGENSGFNCITHQSQIFDTMMITVDYGDARLNIDASDRLLHTPSTGMTIERTESGKTIVESADACESIDFLDYRHGYKVLSVTTSGSYTFTPSSSTVVSIIGTSDYSYNASDPCMGIDTLIGSNYIVGQSNNVNPGPLTVTLESDQRYTLVLGASSIGSSTIDISGPGTVIEDASPNAGTLYSFIAVDTAGSTIAMVANDGDFTELTEGVYEVYGVSYLANTYTPYWLGRSLSYALANNQCMIVSSNYHMLTIVGCDITETQLSNVQCNDNGSDNSIDDYITFDIDPIAIAGGATYQVSLNGKYLSPSVGVYGDTSSFALPRGSAGNGDVTVTLTDVRHEENNMCVTDLIISDPGRCSVDPPVCIAQESRILSPSTMSVVFEDESLDLDELSHFTVQSVSTIDISRDILGKSIVNFNGSCDTIDFIDHYIGTVEIAVGVTGEYTFTPNSTAIVSIIDVDNYTYNPLDPCTNSGTLVGSNYVVGGDISQGALTVALSNTKRYVMVVGGSTQAMSSISASGAGQVYEAQDVISGNAYTYIAVDDENSNVVLVSDDADFTTLTSGNYKVYGVSYLEYINTSDWVGMELSQVVNSSICATTSSNYHTIEVITCEITNVVLHLVRCNDNATDNPLDDYISFRLRPTGNGLSTSYDVNISNNTVSPPSRDYGLSGDFVMPSGTAGSGDVMLTVTDGNNSSLNPCSTTVTISDPGYCSPGEPVCVSQASRLCDTGAITASSGTTALSINSNGKIFSEPTSSIDVVCTTNGPSLADNNGSCSSSLPIQLSNGAKQFSVSETGQYTFSADAGVVVAVIRKNTYTYNAGSPCSNIGTFIGSNFLSSGNFSGTSLTVSLLSCESYQLVIGSNVTGTETIAVSGIGDVYENIPETPGSAYSYIAVNDINDDIAIVNMDGNFRGLTTGTYKIYGVSHLASIYTQGWVGQKSEDVFQEPLCALKSSNYIPVNIECNANTIKNLLPQDIMPGMQFHDGHIIAGSMEKGKVTVDVNNVVFRAVNSVEFHPEFELTSPNELTVEFMPCPNFTTNEE